jgi:hypothetical protein
VNKREIISQAEAIARGLKRYFTGKPCTHGHVCERHVSNTWCVDCGPRYKLTYRAKHPARYREQARQQNQRQRTLNPQKVKEAINRAKAKKPEHYRNLRRRWMANNKERKNQLSKESKDRVTAAYFTLRDELGLFPNARVGEKLSLDAVEEIKQEYQRQMMPSGFVRRGTRAALAKKFNVSVRTIGGVVFKARRPDYDRDFWRDYRRDYYKRNKKRLLDRGKEWRSTTQAAYYALQELGILPLTNDLRKQTWRSKK